MKVLLSTAMLLSMGMFLVGCSASADVDPNHDHSSSSSNSYEKKTVTEHHPDGSTETHTEMHKDN